jgi:hypothetical protein
MKVESLQRRREPWRGKDPGELRTRSQSKPLDRETDSHVEQNPEGGSNAKRVTALETACGYVGGTKLWRVTPRADPA